MKLFFGLVLFLSASLSTHARLGETEAEMIARFGQPALRSKHSTIAQGKIWDLGPSFCFRQDDWQIHCDLFDGRCVRIRYGKTGDWTDEQIQLVLSYNSQGLTWTETSKTGSKVARSWKRSDGASADWTKGGSMKMVVPAYDRAKEVVEAKAKAESSKKPKI
jgi:hypothetical protein